MGEEMISSHVIVIIKYVGTVTLMLSEQEMEFALDVRSLTNPLTWKNQQKMCNHSLFRHLLGCQEWRGGCH